MSSIFVVVYPPPRHFVVAPGTLYYYRGPSDPSGPLPTQIATNTHFIGRFRPASFSVLRGLRENPATDYVQSANLPETNVHFVGRFRQPQFARFRYSSEDAASSTLPAQSSTEPHFVARHRPAIYTVLRGLRENAATDYVISAGPPETNVHFIGRFTVPQFKRANYTGSAGDLLAAAQAETNTHFIARHRQPNFTLLRALRENAAVPEPVASPTSYIFPGVNWHWTGNLPTLGFSDVAVTATWTWQPNPPTQSFSTATQQKAWVWNAQAPALGFLNASAQKSWVWAKNAPLLGLAITGQQKAWRWFAQGFTSPGIIQNVIQYLYWVFGW